MAVYKPTDEIKIPQSKYDKLKEDYFKKSENCLFTLCQIQ